MLLQTLLRLHVFSFVSACCCAVGISGLKLKQFKKAICNIVIVKSRYSVAIQNIKIHWYRQTEVLSNTSSAELHFLQLRGVTAPSRDLFGTVKTTLEVNLDAGSCGGPVPCS